VVTPHAGYPYSGPIAGKAFSLLAHANGAPNRILLIGPPHFVTVRGVVAPSSRAFGTPLGDVAVDVGAVEVLRDAGLVSIDDTPHTPEHALEVELPFLQRVLEDFTIVPLLDPRLNANPRVDEAHHRVPPAGFKYLVTEMLCWAAGGPQKYTGRSMKDSHRDLMITAAEWDAFLDDLQQTLDKFAVPQAEQAEIKAIIDSTRADIVV